MGLIDVRAAFADLREMPPKSAAPRKRDWFEEGRLPPWAGYETDAGVVVNEASALRVVTAWRCVSLLAATISTLPRLIYRQLARGKERSQMHPLYPLLYERPNSMMTSQQMFEAIVHHLLVYGNAFALIDRPIIDPSMPEALYLLAPDRVRVDVRERGVRYWYRMGRGGEYEIASEDMLHWTGLTHDGVVGLGPIEQCKRSLGLAIAAEKYGSRFFGNAAHPGGVLSTKDELDEDERERVRQSIEDGYRGHKQLSLMLLDGDWHYQPLGIPPEQAQFLQTRVKQDADVCRIFGVPPWLIGVPVEGSKPYANVEQEMINFVVLTIRPLLVRLESTINAQLFPMIPGRGREYFFEILVDGLLRGDGVSRFQRYQLGVRNGIYSPNEVRELENLSPYDGGDVYASQQAETAVHEEGGA